MFIQDGPSASSQRTVPARESVNFDAVRSICLGSRKDRAKGRVYGKYDFDCPSKPIG